MYGPYSEVQINPNRNLDEEGLPFISDPSNNDNFNDSARKSIYNNPESLMKHLAEVE